MCNAKKQKARRRHAPSLYLFCPVLTGEHVDDGEEDAAHLVLGVRPQHAERAGQVERRVAEPRQRQLGQRQHLQKVLFGFVFLKGGALCAVYFRLLGSLEGCFFIEV